MERKQRTKPFFMPVKNPAEIKSPVGEVNKGNIGVDSDKKEMSGWVMFADFLADIIGFLGLVPFLLGTKEFFIALKKRQLRIRTKK